MVVSTRKQKPSPERTGMFRDVSKGVLALIGGTALVIVVGLLIGSMFLFSFGFFSQKTANFRGETEKRNQIEANGAFRVATYNHFYDMCAQVQTAEQSVANLKEELLTTDDAQRKLVINASITALRNTRAEIINQYNVDSRKSYTEQQFKASDLPATLKITDKETECTA